MSDEFNNQRSVILSLESKINELELKIRQYRNENLKLKDILKQLFNIVKKVI